MCTCDVCSSTVKYIYFYCVQCVIAGFEESLFGDTEVLAPAVVESTTTQANPLVISLDS